METGGWGWEEKEEEKGTDKGRQDKVNGGVVDHPILWCGQFIPSLSNNNFCVNISLSSLRTFCSYPTSTPPCYFYLSAHALPREKKKGAGAVALPGSGILLPAPTACAQYS